jgi:DNA-binding SARP family transcriptional activator
MATMTRRAGIVGILALAFVVTALASVAYAEIIGDTNEVDELKRTAKGDQMSGYYRRQAKAPVESHGCSVLRVRLFSGFEVSCGGERVALSRNSKAVTILKYLVVHRGELVSQDHLMAWLWPESNLRNARWSLNSTIHNLRRLLSSCSSLPSENHVLFEEGYYRLCPAIRIETDVDDFNAHYERGRRLKSEGRIPEAVAEYEKAVELYVGDYLVEDVYKDWTMVERERLVSAYIEMLSLLATHYYDTERYHESLHMCFRLLSKDPCYEWGHRCVIECYLSLGLHIRAAHQYQQYQHILLRKLGWDPSPEMQKLHRRILQRSS